MPVLPWVPGGRPAPAAVPLVTTAAIMDCRSVTTVGSSGWGGVVSSGAPAMRRGACRLPLSTAAATVAMASGETTTLACPMAVAARSASELGVGIRPPEAVKPRWGVTPRPNWRAVEGKDALGRVLARPMNAALQDWAKAWLKLWNVWPPTVMLAGQLAGLDGLSPCSTRSAVGMILNVEPGGYWPVSARSTAWVLGRLTAATTLPVEAVMATSAAGWVTPLRACSAARWSVGSMLVWTGVPGWEGKVAGVDTTFPL